MRAVVPFRIPYRVDITPAGRRYVQVLLQRRHRRAAAETDRPVIQAGTFAMLSERARVVALQAGHLAASTRRACASHPSRSQACCMSCYRARCMSCRPASAHVSVIRHAVRRMTRVRYSMRRRAHAFIVRCANGRAVLCSTLPGVCDLARVGHHGRCLWAQLRYAIRCSALLCRPPAATPICSTNKQTNKRRRFLGRGVCVRPACRSAAACGPHNVRSA